MFRLRMLYRYHVRGALLQVSLHSNLGAAAMPYASLQGASTCFSGGGGTAKLNATQLGGTVCRAYSFSARIFHLHVLSSLLSAVPFVQRTFAYLLRGAGQLCYD